MTPQYTCVSELNARSYKYSYRVSCAKPGLEAYRYMYDLEIEGLACYFARCVARSNFFNIVSLLYVTNFVGTKI